MPIYLKHSGIKGQRWGVRRYQNEDGSLTSVGKTRYGTSENVKKAYTDANIAGAKTVLEGSSKSMSTLNAYSDKIGKNKSKTINKKNYDSISDEELRKKINRISMEKTYGELTGDRKKVRSGSDIAREILQTAGVVTAIGASAAATAYSMRQITMNKKAQP